MDKKISKVKIYGIKDVKKKWLKKILKSSKEFRDMNDVSGMKIISLTSSRY